MPHPIVELIDIDSQLVPCFRISNIEALLPHPDVIADERIRRGVGDDDKSIKIQQ